MKPEDYRRWKRVVAELVSRRGIMATSNYADFIVVVPREKSRRNLYSKRMRMLDLRRYSVSYFDDFCRVPYGSRGQAEGRQADLAT